MLPFYLQQNNYDKIVSRLIFQVSPWKNILVEKSFGDLHSQGVTDSAKRIEALPSGRQWTCVIQL